MALHSDTKYNVFKKAFTKCLNDNQHWILEDPRFGGYDDASLIFESTLENVTSRSRKEYVDYVEFIQYVICKYMHICLDIYRFDLSRKPSITVKVLKGIEFINSRSQNQPQVVSILHNGFSSTNKASHYMALTPK